MLLIHQKGAAGFVILYIYAYMFCETYKAIGIDHGAISSMQSSDLVASPTSHLSAKIRHYILCGINVSALCTQL